MKKMGEKRMRQALRMSLTTTFTALLVTALFSPSTFSQGKPLISEELRAVISSDGPAAATERFNEIYPAQKDQYTIDTQGLTSLGMEYMQSGNTEAGMAVIAAATRVAQEMASQAMGTTSDAVHASVLPQQGADQTHRETARQPADLADFDQGPARDDLGRFAGIYGDPDEPDPNRTLWVMPSCDGYLVSGANWGDAAAWWLRSTSDTSFHYEDSFTSLQMSFANGAMSHNLGELKTPLQRRGDLPGDWPDCMKRPLR